MASGVAERRLAVVKVIEVKQGRRDSLIKVFLKYISMTGDVRESKSPERNGVCEEFKE